MIGRWHHRKNPIRMKHNSKPIRMRHNRRLPRRHKVTYIEILAAVLALLALLFFIPK